jgi:hypothetical protein
VTFLPNGNSIPRSLQKPEIVENSALASSALLKGCLQLLPFSQCSSEAFFGVRGMGINANNRQPLLDNSPPQIA